jgi:hypothetical protein
LSSKNGVTRITEAKSSSAAPLTANKKTGYPIIEQHGGTVVGKKGGNAYPAGTKIPPTKVDVVRPNGIKQKD